MISLRDLWQKHRDRQEADPNHDRSPCVCCCTDCEDLLPDPDVWWAGTRTSR